jgi:hypothetical protein
MQLDPPSPSLPVSAPDRLKGALRRQALRLMVKAVNTGSG